jgi:hypothetical protein
LSRVEVSYLYDLRMRAVALARTIHKVLSLAARRPECPPPILAASRAAHSSKHPLGQLNPLNHWGEPEFFTKRVSRAVKNGRRKAIRPLPSLTFHSREKVRLAFCPLSAPLSRGRFGPIDPRRGEDRERDQYRRAYFVKVLEECRGGRRAQCG